MNNDKDCLGGVGLPHNHTPHSFRLSDPRASFLSPPGVLEFLFRITPLLSGSLTMAEQGKAGSPKNPIVFFDISFGGQPMGRIKMELFANVCPKTAENFRQFCTGEMKCLLPPASSRSYVLEKEGNQLDTKDALSIASLKIS